MKKFEKKETKKPLEKLFCFLFKKRNKNVLSKVWKSIEFFFLLNYKTKKKKKSIIFLKVFEKNSTNLKKMKKCKLNKQKLQYFFEVNKIKKKKKNLFKNLNSFKNTSGNSFAWEKSWDFEGILYKETS